MDNFFFHVQIDFFIFQFSIIILFTVSFSYLCICTCSIVQSRPNLFGRLRLPLMHIHIEFIKAKIDCLLIHDVITDSCWFFFSASSSARRLKNLLPSLPIPPYANITIGVKLPCSTSNIRSL